MNIALASDHAGFEQLKNLQLHLESLGHKCRNFGPNSYDQNDDYPDFIRPAAFAVGRGECEAGVVIGGSGQGEAIVANRISGVRCAVFYGPSIAKNIVDSDGRTSHDPYEIIKLSRLHNDANMLSFGARFVSVEEMKNVIKLWLATSFSSEERHQRRIKKIDERKDQ